MKKNVKKILLIVGAILIICVLCFIMSRTSENSNYADKYEGVDLTAEVEGLNREGTYSEYLDIHAGAMFPDARVSVDVCEYDTGKGVTVQKEYSGKKDVLYTEDESTVTWKIEVPEAGFYQIYLEYMTVESRGVAIERSLYINGEEPFEDAANLMFGRFWTDGGEVKTDNQGNEIRPTQVETYEWQSAYCRDDMGYETEPYQFYFEKGENTITLEAVNEPMIISKLELTPD